MAKGRFLSKSISESLQVARLKSDSTRLLFTWMIPHADCEGRIIADPRYIKGIVLTFLNHSLGDIAEMLLDLHAEKLIQLFDVDGETHAEFPKFNEHQQGLRKEREAKSKIPSAKGRSPDLAIANLIEFISAEKDVYEAQNAF